MTDLLMRLLASGRPNRFADYWGKRLPPVDESSDPEDVGLAVEIDKHELREKMGRPSKKRMPAVEGQSVVEVRKADAASSSDSAESDQAA